MQSGSILYVTGSLGAVVMFYSRGLILQMTVAQLLVLNLYPLSGAEEVSRGESATSNCPFMMKLMVWYLVNDTHKTMTILSPAFVFAVFACI